MIIRVFRARIQNGKVTDFKQIIQEQTVPNLKSSDGMLSFYGGESLDEEKREFVMVTLWRDLESLKRFVGDNWRIPAVSPDGAALVEEMQVDHFQSY